MVGWLWNSALLTQCVPFWKDCELALLCKNTKNTYWPTRISWDGIGLLFLGCLWRSCIDVCIYWGVSSSVHVSNSLFTITCVQLLTFALVNPFIRILVCMFLWVYSYNRASTLDYISIYIYMQIYMYIHVSSHIYVSQRIHIHEHCYWVPEWVCFAPGTWPSLSSAPMSCWRCMTPWSRIWCRPWDMICFFFTILT